MEFGIGSQIQAFSSCPTLLGPSYPHLTDQPAVDYTNPDNELHFRYN